MEVDALVKSILKKPKTVIQNKGRKVTFSNTVRLFLSDKNASNTSDIPQLKYVEISIIDKSSDTKSVNISNNLLFDDCKAEDFLVHKVIYDNDMIPDDENEHDIIPDYSNHETHNNMEHNVSNDGVKENNESEKLSNEPTSLIEQPSCDIELNEGVTYEPSIGFDAQTEDELDFVVHKVTNLEVGGREFVVHKVTQNDGLDFDPEVTDLEDNSIIDESDSSISNSDMENNCIEASSSTNMNIDSQMKPFSELSIENILEHDKIIAYNDQNCLSSSTIVDAMSNVLMLDKLMDFRKNDNDYLPTSDVGKKIVESVVLSPPLQELSLEKIVRAHSDNVLCELDISPLNSIQETDSESDISSEDTMIMMTSEECQKNEQHIKQSFLQYQSIKESKLVDVNDIKISFSDVEVKDYSKIENNNEIKFTQDNLTKNSYINSDNSECTHNSKKLFNHAKDNGIDESAIKLKCEAVNIPQSFKGFRTSFIAEKNIYPSDKYDSNSMNGFKNRTNDNSSGYWDKTLSAVKIPKDVREWKIMPNSINKNSDSCSSRGNESLQYNCDHQTVESEIQTFIKTDDLPQNYKPDELEHFVNESTERVERIRKRYHLNEKTQLKFGIVQHSPVRGIRPRFGSTAEILQLMQKQNQSSFLHYDSTRNHMSWPFSDTSSKSQIQDHEKQQHSSGHFFVNQRQASDYSSQSSFESTYRDELIHSNICDHYSLLSCPLPGERGVPEGASPPRSLIDHGSDEDFTDQSQTSDNVVYYSMKV